MQRVLVVVLLGLMMSLVACGGGEEELHTIDPNDRAPAERAIELTAEALLGNDSDEENDGVIAGDTTDQAADDITEAGTEGTEGGAAGVATATPDGGSDEGADVGADDSADDATTATPDDAAGDGTDDEATDDASAGSEGDPDEGEALFTMATLEGAPGCAACHSLEEGVRLAGPSLAGLGERAGSMDDDLSAEEYVRQSIVEPNAIIVEGFPPIMPQNYGDVLSDEEISHLVDFLLAQ